MNDERDPITEWEHAIYRRIGSFAVALLLAAFVCAVIAPLFGGWIKRTLYRRYALCNDCEAKVEHTMKFVWIWLWLIAAAAWTIIFWSNLVTPHG